MGRSRVKGQQDFQLFNCHIIDLLNLEWEFFSLSHCLQHIREHSLLLRGVKFDPQVLESEQLCHMHRRVVVVVIVGILGYYGRIACHEIRTTTRTMFLVHVPNKPILRLQRQTFVPFVNGLTIGRIHNGWPPPCRLPTLTHGLVIRHKGQFRRRWRTFGTKERPIVVLRRCPHRGDVGVTACAGWQRKCHSLSQLRLQQSK